jgi:hypothetical protein
VLQEADLIAAEKQGRAILYRIKLSVLEDALLSFAQAVGLGSRVRGRARRARARAPVRVLRGTT